jgi:hypothetical protein
MTQPGPRPTVTTWSGGADVIASGSVIAFGTGWDSSISLLLSFSDGTSLSVRFEFEDDEAKAEPRIDSETCRTEIRLRLINFDNLGGVGNTKPLLLGNLDGVPFYLNIRVFQLQGGAKTLHYTFYVRDDASVNARRKEAQLKALQTLRDPPAKL